MYTALFCRLSIALGIGLIIVGGLDVWLFLATEASERKDVACGLIGVALVMVGTYRLVRDRRLEIINGLHRENLELRLEIVALSSGRRPRDD